VGIKRRGEQRAENARQAPGALCHTMVAPCSFAGARLDSNPKKRRARQGGTHRQQRQRQKHLDPLPVGAMENCSHLSCPSPLMNGRRIKLMPVRNRLSVIIGSPNILTSRPMAPPWMTAPMMPQKTKREMTVVAGLVFGPRQCEVEMSLTTSGRVLSKQLKANVPEKNQDSAGDFG